MTLVPSGASGAQFTQGRKGHGNTPTQKAVFLPVADQASICSMATTAPTHDPPSAASASAGSDERGLALRGMAAHFPFEGYGRRRGVPAAEPARIAYLTNA